MLAANDVFVSLVGNQVLLTLSTGDSIGLVGVSLTTFNDAWVVFA